MADTIKISELPAATIAHDTDQFETNQGGTSRRLTLAQLRAGVLGGVATLTKTIADAAYTLLAADNGLTLRFTSAAPVAVTFPGDLPADWQAILFQAGDGPVSCVEDSSSTIECGFDAVGALHRTIEGKGFSVHAWCDENADDASAHYWLQGVTRT